jgi:hypothetical protein
MTLKLFLVDAADNALDLRLLNGQDADAVAHGDGGNQFGGGDLITPEAPPAS